MPAKKKITFRRRTSVARKPRSSYYTGKGAYKARKPKYNKTRKDLTSGILSMVKPGIKLLSSGVGGPVGGALGEGLAGMVGNFFTGKGEYSIKQNSLLAEQIGTPPLVKNPSGPGVMIRRCEYIGDIISSATAGAFSLNSYDVNPGLENTFQWLSQVAANFDEWVCEGMYFEYRSMSADALNSTNTALGTVIMAAQYNSALPNFASKQAMENYEGGVSCRPSVSMRYFVECARNQTVLSDLYIRTGSVPSGLDQRFYDLCNFQIATQGMQGQSVNVGELWVSYQVSLRKPKMFVGLGLYDSFYEVSMTAGVANNAPIGTTYSVDTNSNLAISLTSTVITFPRNSLPQSYFFLIDWTGSSAANVVAPAFTFGTNLVGTSRTQSPVNTVTSTKLTIAYTVFVPANNLTNTITLGGAGTLPVSSTAFMYIIQVPNTYLGQ